MEGYERLVFDEPTPGNASSSSALSVTQALTLAKQTLEDISLTVIGEVSDLSDKAGYKAVYFTISDEGAAMSCLIWRNIYDRCDIQIRTGMLVEVTGSFSLYLQKGRMNFVVKRIRLAGEGDLRLKVAQLARKLEREGLMDPRRKRPVPALPEHIAIVTSPRGKAVHDCLRTLKRRYPIAEAIVCGVTVEGAAAVDEIIGGLRCAADSDAEVILLVRGGGSYEDLMPFNDENLARAIVRCPIPVVTGIGHEPDNSIADMVSDLRCSTPTAAAEAVAPNLEELFGALDEEGHKMAVSLQRKLDRESAGLDGIVRRAVFRDPNSVLASYNLDVDAIQGRLKHAIPDALARDEHALSLTQQRFRQLPQHIFTRFENALAIDASRLEDLSPLAILSRGYAVAYGPDGRSVIDSVDKVAPGQDIHIQVNDGIIDAQCRSTRRKDH